LLFYFLISVILKYVGWLAYCYELANRKFQAVYKSQYNDSFDQYWRNLIMEL